MPFFQFAVNRFDDGHFRVEALVSGVVVASGIFTDLKEPQNNAMWLDCEGAAVRTELGRELVAEAYRSVLKVIHHTNLW